jgi:hypothetical protein
LPRLAGRAGAGVSALHAGRQGEQRDDHSQSRLPGCVPADHVEPNRPPAVGFSRTASNTATSSSRAACTMPIASPP